MKKIKIIVLILFWGQLALAQTDMKNMPGMQAQQPVTYTCPMHPEIHAAKPGNCPKCGMKLVKEKPKAAVKKSGDMMMPVKDTLKKAGDMNGMKMDRKKSGSAPQKTGSMTMPLKEPGKKAGDVDGSQMEGMKMDDQNPTAAASKDAKANLGPIKTLVSQTPPHTVRYDLYVADTIVNYGGKPKRAIAVNGSIPMPTLTFTEGDTAEIYVHNQLKEETSLHWHGLFLPNRYDGVPNMTQMPIMPGETHLYKFPIRQHGTHWYHSHTGLQEQIGMYGAFIMNKRQEWDIPTLPVVLSDWTNMNPKGVERSLHAASDWFAIQKGSTQSYLEAIRSGHFKTKVANEWKRMNAMDVSDVYYDKFLVNGKNQNEQPQYKAGDKVRLRIANGGASSYFWLKYAGGKMTVVATDGNDVEPVEVDRLIIAVSETYDVVVTIPENKSYEFLVTPEDRTKSASLWLGSGPKVYAGKMPKLKYFAGMKMMNDMMDMNGNMVQMEGMNMQNQIMDMNTVMYPEITGEEKPKAEDKKSSMPGMQMPNDNSMAGMNMAADNSDMVTLNYNMLRDPHKTTLPKGPTRELKFDLTGNMNRYVWTLDNKTVSESDKILIRKGENLRIILYNNSMMRHPMHLHGHDFRVLNGQGENAPMKNVIDIMPMEKDTIEFAASEAGGDWFFHCHILYHMMSGMGRVFSYENSPPNPDVPDPKLAQRRLFWDDQMPHLMGRIGLESNGSDGQVMLGSTRWKASTMWHLGTDAMMGYESETMIGRYIGRNQWLYPYVGFDYHYKKFNPDEKNIFGSDYRNLFGQVSNKENRHTVVAGIAYTLPMLFVADARIDGNGKLRFQLGREDVPVTQRLRFNIMVNTDKEYAAGLRYIFTKYFSLSTHYDSDMGLGGGLTLTY
ncbi:copper-resistance protein, CopA family [Mucilaginibacter gossypiicola]|uniref:Copper-resistance protein, CopA family n=2 Tax=Mucilaginibacter gossypiicola TaxID=551995 RepID=A0A1H8DKT5_9SPHI|nr:multicopper oxidase domain-containing protein [Mucilaginibacter gossypiicola]SEN07765.1 copper-resistance protein, CopA family [Mucilaginibacter gossypiicola]